VNVLAFRVSIWFVMQDESDVFKVVICGNSAVGKTSIVQRYCFNHFQQLALPTMGADFVSHSVRLPTGEVKLHIWDTAGQEQYQAIGPLFYRGAAMAFVVYAVTDDDALIDVQSWIDRIHAAEPSAKIVVFANKVDLVGHTPEDVAEWCELHQIPHFFCSAMTGTGIHDGFQRAATILRAARPASSRVVLLQPPHERSCC
jgi:small GTP-binding protein